MDVKNIGYKRGGLDIYFIMEQQLSDKDRKTLDIFSMYLQSYASKVGKYTIEVSTDGDIYWDSPYWMGDNTTMMIDTYDAIDELIKRIFNENEDTMLNNFTSDDRGEVVAIVNCNDRTLSFKDEVRVLDTDYQNQEYTFDDITNKEIRAWLKEAASTYSSGQVDYSGGGDDGYIENYIVFNDGKVVKYPRELANWLSDQLQQFGSWANEDGGQGDFYFNFTEKTIGLSHGQNYYTDDIHEIPLKFTF